jgi:hypothetical protein
VLYVSHHTYTQAAVLESTFGGDMERLAEVLKVNLEDSDYGEAVYTFYEQTPSPMNMLAPFLGLLRDLTFNQSDYRSCAGFLHVMSQTIDFRAFANAPAEVRADTRFGLAALKTFDRSWEELETQLLVPVKDDTVETNIIAIFNAHLELIRELRENGGVVVRTAEEKSEKNIDLSKQTFNEPATIDWEALWASAEKDAEEEIKKKREEEEKSSPRLQERSASERDGGSKTEAPPALSRKGAEGGEAMLNRALGGSNSVLTDVPKGKVRADEDADISDIMAQFGGGSK